MSAYRDLHARPLYEQVWGERRRSVAKSYGISDVALARIREKLSLPTSVRSWL